MQNPSKKQEKPLKLDQSAERSLEKGWERPVN